MDEIVLKKIEEFFTSYKHLVYKKGEILIRADDPPVGIFYLKEGRVKQYAISKNGDEHVVNIFKPNTFFPMSWAINQTPNSYFFEAMTNIEIWRAPKEDVVSFIKNNPDVSYDLLSRVYKGIDGILARMSYLMSGNAYSRLITELLIYAKRFAKEHNTVTIEISEKDLASQSGMTRETVSREMKILKDNGFITTDNHKFIIKDVHRLEDELGIA